MSSEVNQAREEIRKSVDEWKELNQGWENQESIKKIKSRVGKKTYKDYTVMLPVFFQWEETTPDEMLNKRIKQFRSDNLKERFYYEDRLSDYQKYLIANHYKASTIKTMLAKVSGFFSNHRLNLQMEPSFWKRSDKFASEIVEGHNETRRYPTNEEVRAILELASRQEKLGVLLGYQCGLMPVDICSLTWDRFNIDFEKEERDFIFVENIREKTRALHIFIVTPDIFHFLKIEWVAQGRPNTGYVFKGYNGNKLQAQSIVKRYRSYAKKALGKRGSKFIFKNLRQSFNEALLDANVTDEVKNVLMGHLRRGSKSSYSISSLSVAKIYQDEVYSKLAVNGWNFDKKKDRVNELEMSLDLTNKALSQVEEENSVLKKRVDNLQEQIDRMETNFNKAMVQIMSEQGLDFVLVPSVKSDKETS